MSGNISEDFKEKQHSVVAESVDSNTSIPGFNFFSYHVTLDKLINLSSLQVLKGKQAPTS